MKKYQLLLFIALSFVGCDRKTMLFIDNEGIAKTIHTSCGKVEVKAHMFGSSRLTITYNFKDGVHYFDPDMFKIGSFDPSNEVKKIHFRNYGYKETTDLKRDTIVSPRKINATIYLKNSSHVIKPPITFYIVPTNYLKCNDKMAIKDTLYLHYR